MVAGRRGGGWGNYDYCACVDCICLLLPNRCANRTPCLCKSWCSHLNIMASTGSSDVPMSDADRIRELEATVSDLARQVENMKHIKDRLDFFEQNLMLCHNNITTLHNMIKDDHPNGKVVRASNLRELADLLTTCFDEHDGRMETLQSDVRQLSFRQLALEFLYQERSGDGGPQENPASGE